MNRRNFLKYLGIGTAGAVVAQTLPAAAPIAEAAVEGSPAVAAVKMTAVPRGLQIPYMVMHPQQLYAYSKLTGYQAASSSPATPESLEKARKLLQGRYENQGQ